MLVRLRPFLLTLLLAAAVPSVASADYRKIYDECQEGVLTNSYSAKELKQAADNLSGYDRDYSSCADAIARAQNQLGKTKSNATDGSGTANGGSTGGSAGGGSTGSGTGGTAGGGGGGGTTDGTDAVSDARQADVVENQEATNLAIQQANEAAAAQERALAGVQIPASALGLGTSGESLPVPLLVALLAGCVAAAAVAGIPLAQAVIRRRRAG